MKHSDTSAPQLTDTPAISRRSTTPNVGGRAGSQEREGPQQSKIIAAGKEGKV